MENPYQSPQEPIEPLSGDPLGDPFQRRSRFMHHVRVVAILMIVQGVLELIASVAVGAIAIFISSVNAGQAQGPTPEMFWIRSLFFGGVAIAALVAAVLHITAGVRNFRFRGKTLGIVAMACGMLTMFTCYCLPTAVGLGVYGLIVYLNDDVSEAFRMGEAGQTVGQILAAFRQ